MMIKKTEDFTEEAFARLALYYTEQVGARLAGDLIQHFGSAQNVFKAGLRQLLRMEGIGETRARAIKAGAGKRYADSEISFMQQEGIRLLFREDPEFPQRLLQCSDAPFLLFRKGPQTANTTKTIAIVGTRAHSDYGKKITRDLVSDLSSIKELTIISGLAAGIDTIAHREALQRSVPTIGVLGHGLHTTYPSANRQLAKDMCGDQAALFTEFGQLIKVEKGNFPSRNRIIAGMSDITVVVESAIKGGALITARIAASYNREVCAFPGRISDPKSEGTHALIRENCAALVTSAADILRLMNWESGSPKTAPPRQLLLHLSGEEQQILQLLQTAESLHADELLARSGIHCTQLAGILLALEMQQLIRSLPGKRYSIC